MNSEFKLISSWRLFPDWFSCAPLKELKCCQVPTMNRVLPWEWHHCSRVSTVHCPHNSGESESIIDGNYSAIPGIILLLHCCYCCMFGHAYSWPVAGWSLRGSDSASTKLDLSLTKLSGMPCAASSECKGPCWDVQWRCKGSVETHMTSYLVPCGSVKLECGNDNVCFTVTACVARCSLLTIGYDLLHFTIA
jgi:hypothetical protein